MCERVCDRVCVCSSGLISLDPRLEVDALCAQDCGSGEDCHAEVNDTL